VPFPQRDLAIHGTRGRIIGRNVTRAYFDGVLEVRIGDQETTTPVTSKDAFDRMVQAFNRAVIEDREPSASGLDGLRSAQVARAILKSAREGVRVRVEYEQ
jgi:1,5-anhydro-D-fructose reductase (1,5-anhydro-D-mannitol-forming)